MFVLSLPPEAVVVVPMKAFVCVDETVTTRQGGFCESDRVCVVAMAVCDG